MPGSRLRRMGVAAAAVAAALTGLVAGSGQAVRQGLVQTVAQFREHGPQAVG
jgi:hypothetical protein